MPKKGGFICAYRPCPNSTGHGVSHFCFPMDPIRAKEWIIACDRRDLEKYSTEHVSKHYRLCEQHFEDKYLMRGKIRKNLTSNAVPTIFLCEEQTEVHKGTIGQELIISRTPQMPSVPSTYTRSIFNMPVPIAKTESLNNVTSTSTQTSCRLTGITLRKRKLEDFFRMCDKYLSKPLSNIVKVQAMLKDKQATGRRYSTEYKQFAMALYFLSPRAYSFMNKLLYLPSKRTLELMASKLVLKPGLENTSLFKALEAKAKFMSDLDKHCVLCIDEMPLKANLFYCTKRDEVIGFHCTNIKRTLLAHNVNVFMIRGINSDWKQPITYFFVHSQLSAVELRSNVHKCITLLHRAGLYVHALITNMGTNFTQLANLLGITSENQKFTVDSRNIFYIFDTCDLIKATRNNLLENVLSYNEKKTSWSFIGEFYQQDKKQFYRCAPKLTDAHINPSSFDKIKLKLATQVLSHTVATGMNTYMSLDALSGDASFTIEVIYKFNKLFDVLNSKKKNNSCTFKNVFEGLDYQLEFLNEMLTFLSDLRILVPGSHDLTLFSKFRSCWIITIKAICQLWTVLKAANFKSLKTRYINQDCLKDFFESIQERCSCINPTPIQFAKTFKILFCQSYLCTDGIDFKDDFNGIFTTISTCSNVMAFHVPELSENIAAIDLPDKDYRYLNFSEQNAFSYICGYLLKKALNIHKCDICIQFLKECDELDINNLLIYFKTHDSNESVYKDLRVPSKQFVHFLYTLEQIFMKIYEEVIIEQGISHNYLQKMIQIPLYHPCSNFSQLYLVKLFIRLRIFYSLKYVNKDSRINKSNYKKYRKIKIISYI
ncbi:kelch-like protein 10 isoform X1 [Halictus rubicundus]|uniref:kelch-like protein 10 isoform X1 n=1 Tax=Halictus rubicundus TaxID=77578 RepID=UPI004036E9E2